LALAHFWRNQRPSASAFGGGWLWLAFGSLGETSGICFIDW